MKNMKMNIWSVVIAALVTCAASVPLMAQEQGVEARPDNLPWLNGNTGDARWDKDGEGTEVSVDDGWMFSKIFKPEDGEHFVVYGATKAIFNDGQGTYVDVGYDPSAFTVRRAIDVHVQQDRVRIMVRLSGTAAMFPFYAQGNLGGGNGGEGGDGGAHWAVKSTNEIQAIVIEINTPAEDDDFIAKTHPICDATATVSLVGFDGDTCQNSYSIEVSASGDGEVQFSETTVTLGRVGGNWIKSAILDVSGKKNGSVTLTASSDGNFPPVNIEAIVFTVEASISEVAMFVNSKNYIDLSVVPAEAAGAAHITFPDGSTMTFDGGVTFLELGEPEQRVEVFGSNIFNESAVVGSKRVAYGGPGSPDKQAEADDAPNHLFTGFARSLYTLTEERMTDYAQSMPQRLSAGFTDIVLDRIWESVDLGLESGDPAIEQAAGRLRDLMNTPGANAAIQSGIYDVTTGYFSTFGLARTQTASQAQELLDKTDLRDKGFMPGWASGTSTEAGWEFDYDLSLRSWREIIEDVLGMGLEDSCRRIGVFVDRVEARATYSFGPLGGVPNSELSLATRFYPSRDVCGLRLEKIEGEVRYRAWDTRGWYGELLYRSEYSFSGHEYSYMFGFQVGIQF